MQAPKLRNTSATTARDTELPIGVKEDSYSRASFSTCLDDSKKTDRSSSFKQGDAIAKFVPAIDIVMHEQFPKLSALKDNLDRCEKDIIRITKQCWCSQQGDEMNLSPALDTKILIRGLQASLEAQQENVAHLPVLRRGDNEAVDTIIDRASQILCQECSDIFCHMNRLLVKSRMIEEEPRPIEQDLDLMCQISSPFEEWTSRCMASYVAFSEIWLADDNVEKCSDEPVVMDGFLPFYPVVEAASNESATNESLSTCNSTASINDILDDEETLDVSL